ncbi:beta-hydroxyacyl-ACP dehydratase [Patescibacteria group bacterium]|nr:beta-hydroxyacyl-ACP dehydratase [Patescibacteria group bacterium]
MNKDYNPPTTSSPSKLGAPEIKKIIPYDDPFLFVDGVEEIGENFIIGHKQTKPEDYFFKGHFVDFPIMPGVLVVEAIAQLSSILLRRKIGKDHQKKHILAYQVKNASFYKPIFPGDKIILKAKVLNIIDEKISKILGSALVGNEPKCEVRFICAIIDKKEFEEKYRSK